jgi:hypothetical protein
MWAVRVNRCPVWHRRAGSVKKAIGDVDLEVEMQHCGNYGVQIINQILKEWDLLSDGEMEAVRADPRFRSMPKVANYNGPTQLYSVTLE